MAEGIVWLLQEQPKGRERFDVSTAEAFGRIVPVLVDGEQPGFRPYEAYERIAKKLENFDPETDALLYAGGDPLTLLLAGAVLATRDDVQTVRFLRYHRERNKETGQLAPDGTYVEVMVPVYLGGSDGDEAS